MADGVIVVPREHAEEVAKAIQFQDNIGLERIRKIEKGTKPWDTGYLVRCEELDERRVCRLALDLALACNSIRHLAAYFERHSELWTSTFGDVLRYIQEHKASSIEMKQSDDSSLAIIVHWPMGKEIYDVPLTLKVENTRALEGSSPDRRWKAVERQTCGTNQ
jgi:hypothetical protein